MATKSNEEQRLRMVAMLLNGKSAKEVSEATGVSTTTVNNFKCAIDYIRNENWEDLEILGGRWKSIDSITWIADFLGTEIPAEVMANIRIGIDGNRYGRKNPNAEKNQAALEKIIRSKEERIANDNTAEAFVQMLKRADLIIQKADEVIKVLKEIALQRDSDFEAYLDAKFQQIITGVSELATTEDVKDAAKQINMNVSAEAGNIEKAINTNCDVIDKTARDGLENVRNEVRRKR